MNGLTVAVQAAALEGALAARPDDAPTPATGVVDAGDVDADRFGRRVTERVGHRVDLRADHSADETTAVVGAASILAKVERDRRVEAIAAEYGDVGSGYPSDPTTRAFLRSYVAEHGDLPGCARRSWSTCEDLLRAAEQSSLAEF
jgi:ribonuclease HII